MMRNEYPRPQFVRKEWQNLNGEWAFAFDDENVGRTAGWFNGSASLDQKIQVPFVYQTKLSGIDKQEVHDIVWYEKNFDWSAKSEQRCLLHFGAVDYQAEIYVNGSLAGNHVGGHTSFTLDITELVQPAGNRLTVRVEDFHDSEEIPRGKQFWRPESAGIWYTNTTGIWQTVWLEAVAETYIDSVKFTPDVDHGLVEAAVKLNRFTLGQRLKYTISFKGQQLAEDILKVTSRDLLRKIDLYNNTIFRSNFHDDGWTWSPQNPNLFDVELTLLEDEDVVLDEVSSYFGMRKIHTEKGMVFLNNHPFYQKLVLDQGYWPEGLLTAPTDEDFKKDIQLAKDMGFNGCRKHQKVEDPRFLYWADQMGFIVWGECASAISYTNEAVTNLTKEWFEILERDYNHPCIVTWVPLNESWGIPEVHHDRQQQSFSQGIYHILHALDRTRLVISNDGWEMTETDICAIHNYSHGQKNEVRKYQHFKDSLADVEGLVHMPPGKWATFAEGYEYKGQPLLLTEFGGIGYKVGGQAGWGYTTAENDEQYLEDYARIMTAIFDSKALWGYCYTQLTDVEQEINGILTYDRQPKVDLAKIKEINDSYFPERINLRGQW
ncbi:glycoside hydrolase family 2 protein [Candidatus Enterococcus leclercqii]|uniref:glycoside hydrolase family 2 protein n=1 Tax=Candidatus Enterococcus leclercqii TaxID=1857218 RepID=UPI0013794332|nr:sugar-binding domain-containing protein [Enterococcus sp. CU9D]KAF1290732.1 glycoside hydrolase family 2 [Enterococcus sp. CU9D]